MQRFKARELQQSSIPSNDYQTLQHGQKMQVKLPIFNCTQFPSYTKLVNLSNFPNFHKTLTNTRSPQPPTNSISALNHCSNPFSIPPSLTTNKLFAKNARKIPQLLSKNGRMCRLFVVCSPYIYRRSIKSDKNMKKIARCSNFPPTLLFIGRWEKSVRRAKSELVVTSWLVRHRIESCLAVWRLLSKVPVHPCCHRQIVVDSRAVISRSSDFVTQKSLFLRIVLRLSNNRLAIIVGEREKGKNPLHQRREKKTFVQIDKDCLIVFVFGFCDRARTHILMRSRFCVFLCYQQKRGFLLPAATERSRRSLKTQLVTEFWRK
jgi:hypothetical protein